MIWLRRTIAIFLALTFIILFIPTLVFLQVTDTLANPEFYNNQLHQADIYNFLYDDVLPAALEEAEVGMDDASGLLITQNKSHIISMVEQTLPPEWLQTQVELVINEVVPYAWGDTEHFKVNIPLKDRAETAAQARAAVGQLIEGGRHVMGHAPQPDAALVGIVLAYAGAVKH